MNCEMHSNTSDRARSRAMNGRRRSERFATAAVMTAMLGILLLQTFPAAPGSTPAQAESLAPAVAVLMRGI
jgi:hypothetical protein